jgi:ATP-binding cassette subfamily B protein
MRYGAKWKIKNVTFVYADCIYIMEHGQLVELGTHEELLAVGGIYASL